MNIAFEIGLRYERHSMKKLNKIERTLDLNKRKSENARSVLYPGYDT